MIFLLTIFHLQEWDVMLFPKSLRGLIWSKKPEKEFTVIKVVLVKV